MESRAAAVRMAARMSSPDETSFSAPRALGGGFLMGLANLVPGVSGGTMILALGLYDRFIGALADVTRLKLRRSSVLFLALIVGGAGVAILGLSGVAVDLVTNHRWVMYSLFIGMTLGGAPELWKQCRPLGPAVVVSFLLSVALMAMLAWGLASSKPEATIPVLAGVGALAASSMILPGVSGSYMLLIFGMYDVVLGAVRPRALMNETAEALRVVLPVGVGVLLGIALLSNVLKFLLARFSAASHAALLGLLVGSVLGLWPFRVPVTPELADKPMRKAIAALVEGRERALVCEEFGVDIDDAEATRMRAEYAGSSAGDLKRRAEELEGFDPSGGQIAAALGLLVGGFALTRLLGRKQEPTA